MTFPVTEHCVKTERHTTFYLACGPEDGPLIVFAHGWPELSLSWRHQLPCFGAMGFRCIAPDMRGYGRSSVYPRHEDYALRASTADMLELLDSLGRDKAVFVGHDWGSPVVWSLASQLPGSLPWRCQSLRAVFPPRLRAGESSSVGGSLGLPQDAFPAGQWEFHAVLRAELREGMLAFEANVERHGEGVVPRRQPGRQGPA